MNKLLELISKKFKDSELLTEEVKSELKSIFEKTINEKVEAEVKAKTEIIKEAHQKELDAIIEKGEAAQKEYIDDLTNKADEYLTEAVNQYINDNEMAIDAGIKVEKAEAFMEGITQLYKENNINISEEDNDLLKKSEADVVALKAKIEDLRKDKQEVSAQVFEYEKAMAFNKLTDKLSDVQKDNVLKLYEGISSETIGEFENQVSVIVEKVKDMETNVNDDKTIVEDMTHKSDDNGKYNADVDQWL
jgi:hypothetical protein